MNPKKMAEKRSAAIFEYRQRLALTAAFGDWVADRLAKTTHVPFVRYEEMLKMTKEASWPQGVSN